MDANWKEIEELMRQLFIISETSEACFGMLKQGMVESGSALKRLMIAPLAKAQMIRTNITPEIKKAIALCSQLNGGVTIKEKDINIAWMDGIPTDDVEQATVMATRTGGTGGARTISVRTALKRMDNLSDAQLDEELDRIAEDDAAANPTIGDMGFGTGGGA